MGALEKMHQPAVKAVGGHSEHANLLHQLSLLAIKLEHPRLPEILEGDGMGRRPNPYPLKVAIEVGRHYRFITGSHPTIIKDTVNGKAKGAFLNVLAEVRCIWDRRFNRRPGGGRNKSYRKNATKNKHLTGICTEIRPFNSIRSYCQTDASCAG